MGLRASDPDLRRWLSEAQQAESQQRWGLAAARYRQALRLRPGDHRLQTNAANALWLADQAAEGLPLMQAAAATAPDDWQPWRGLGNLLRDLNRWEEADRAYARSLALADDPLTAWNHSQLLIGLERFPQAYAAAERRLLLPQLEPYRAPEQAALRDAGIALQGQETLHIWSEQGFGDTLQALRWLVALCGRPGPLTLEVEPQLVTLLQRGLSWLERPPRILAKTERSPQPLPGDALQASLLSLPHLLGDAPWPIAPGPYLRLEQGVRARRRRSGAVRVGVVWAAGRKLEDPFTAREYRRRSLPAEAIAQLCNGLKAAGAEPVALQHGADREQGASLSWATWLPDDADFAAAARWLLQLDLLISVDTASAHLCGALGVPGWILLPWSADPRWLRQRSDCPWYPGLRLWRQERPGDWSGVITALLKRFSLQLRQGAGAGW